jgi:hypothetical protein
MFDCLRWSFTDGTVPLFHIPKMDETANDSSNGQNIPYNFPEKMFQTVLDF